MVWKQTCRPLLSARTSDSFIGNNPHVSCIRDPVSAWLKRSNVSNQMSRSLAQRWVYLGHNEAYRRTTARTEVEEVDSDNGLRYLSSQFLEFIRNSKKIMRATRVVFNQPAIFLSLRFEGTRAGAHKPRETGEAGDFMKFHETMNQTESDGQHLQASHWFC